MLEELIWIKHCAFAKILQKFFDIPSIIFLNDFCKFWGHEKREHLFVLINRD